MAGLKRLAIFLTKAREAGIFSFKILLLLGRFLHVFQWSIHGLSGLD